jgi:hypothetical protein
MIDLGVFMKRILSVLVLFFSFTAFSQDEAPQFIDSDKLLLAIKSIKAVEHESPYFKDQVDLVVTSKAPEWKKERTEKLSAILLGGKLSTPGSLISAMAFVRGNRLIACKSIRDRQEENCVFVARVEGQGAVDPASLEAFYTKIVLSPEQKIFCTLVPICANRDFDFVTLEYSPK